MFFKPPFPTFFPQLFCQTNVFHANFFLEIYQLFLAILPNVFVPFPNISSQLFWTNFFSTNFFSANFFQPTFFSQLFSANVFLPTFSTNFSHQLFSREEKPKITRANGEDVNSTYAGKPWPWRVRRWVKLISLFPDTLGPTWRALNQWKLWKLESPTIAGTEIPELPVTSKPTILVPKCLEIKFDPSSEAPGSGLSSARRINIARRTLERTATDL